MVYSDYVSTNYTTVVSYDYIWDGWNLLAEVKDSTTNFYTWGQDLSGSLQGAGGVGGLLILSLNTTNYFPVFDGNGNVMALVATDGTVDAEYEYGPFGEVMKADGDAADDNPFRFSTKYWDTEPGLYYYGRRYYSPSLGRWLSRDPIGERGGDNLYVALLNRMTSSTDGLGLTGELLLQPPDWDSAQCVDQSGRDSQMIESPFVSVHRGSFTCFTTETPSRGYQIAWL